jgi:glycosyltransferase involved in cell wall biosynthesis
VTTLSVVIITLNEEDNIRACLDSVKFADEIVVLDSGSTDNTVEICREYTESVFHQPWLGFAGQKNAALGRAAGDWVLSLDADERVTPELAASIQEVVSESPADVDGFYVYRKVFFGDKWLRHGGFYPEKVLRLVRQGRARFGARSVHEALETDGPTCLIPEDIEHYTYRSVEDYLVRMKRYAALSAQEYYQQGRTTGPVRMTGRALFTFFQMYIIKAGFLDGYEGFLMAVLYGMYTFSKYAILYELRRRPI